MLDKVTEILDASQKADISAAILAALPEWFGIPESTRDYVSQSRKMPFAAFLDGEQAVGFLALKETSLCALEIYVMGILPSYHRKGIGRTLFEWAYQYAQSHDFRFLQVKTLDASANNAEYDRTRSFYEIMGFEPLECLPTLWDEGNPCLIMVMAVAAKKP